MNFNLFLSASFYQKIQQTMKIKGIPRKSKGSVNLLDFLDFALICIVSLLLKPCWVLAPLNIQEYPWNSKLTGKTFNLELQEYS